MFRDLEGSLRASHRALFRRRTATTERLPEDARIRAFSRAVSRRSSDDTRRLKLVSKTGASLTVFLWALGKGVARDARLRYKFQHSRFGKSPDSPHLSLSKHAITCDCEAPQKKTLLDPTERAHAGDHFERERERELFENFHSKGDAPTDARSRRLATETRGWSETESLSRERVFGRLIARPG